MILYLSRIYVHFHLASYTIPDTVDVLTSPGWIISTNCWRESASTFPLLTLPALFFFGLFLLPLSFSPCSFVPFDGFRIVKGEKDRVNCAELVSFFWGGSSFFLFLLSILLPPEVLVNPFDDETVKCNVRRRIRRVVGAREG